MGDKKIAYYTANKNTSETIHISDCGYHETKHGHQSPQTVLDHYVLHFIISGKGTYKVNNHLYNLSKNDAFLLIPRVPISYQADSHDPWVYYWIGFNGVDAQQLMKLCNLSIEHPILHDDSMHILTDIIRPLIDLNSSSLSESYLALSSFYQICSILIQHNTNIKSISNKERYYNQAVSIIQNSYYKQTTVQNIADKIGLDRTYLYRIFKEISGMTIQDYITNLRLQRACYLLLHTDLSYSDIAFYCGYISEQYFSMIFKKKNGIAPSFYRKINKHPL